MEHTIHETARALAVALAAQGWTYRTPKDENDYPRVAHLERKDGVSFYIHTPSYPPKDRGRIFVSGDWPVGPKGFVYRAGSVDYDAKSPGISVAADRGIPALAKAIQTRFLPEFLPLAEAAHQLAKDALARDRSEFGLVDQLKNRFPTLWGGKDHNGNPGKALRLPQCDSPRSDPARPYAYGDVVVSGTDRVDLKVTGVREDVAAKIVALLVYGDVDGRL